MLLMHKNVLGHVPFFPCARPVCAELPVHLLGTDLVLRMMYPVQDLQELESQTPLHGPQKMEWTHLPDKEALQSHLIQHDVRKDGSGYLSCPLWLEQEQVF